MKHLLKIEEIRKKLDFLHLSFDYIKIRLASPTRIKTWAERILPHGEVIGEVSRGETVNFRNHEPETNGLFCQKIFGPIKSWTCRCGKYNGFVLQKVCESCAVEINEARIRRYRMGYIQLVHPVVHYWYLKGVPNYLVLLLRSVKQETKPYRLKASDIENIVYFKQEKEIHWSLLPFSYQPKNTLTTFSHYSKQFRFRYGAEIIKAALEKIDVKFEIQRCRAFLLKKNVLYPPYKITSIKSLVRKTRILESFLATQTNPSWIILTNLPVLPPTLRPLVEMENGKLLVADINEIYRMIIHRNIRLFLFLFQQSIPDLISVHGRKLLQESVDALIDNVRLPKDRQILLNDRPLKSLTETLEGKQGRFRHSLLGKRVDYSGRSVIVVGPQLRLNQCGLPYEMATELFKPFLVNQLLKTKIHPPSHNTRLATLMIKKNKPFIWTLVANLSKQYSILLNRAPTLHRFGIQAFDPIIVLGQAIHLHPLVCTGFNADFDGDQMAVHLPLYEASQLEIRNMMRPSYNVLSPANGQVILKPTQDMVIGCYYLTFMITGRREIIQKWFGSPQAALNTYSQKKISLHTPILVRYKINSLKFKVCAKKLEFLEMNPFLNSKIKEIFIKKLYRNNKNYYFITNFGLFIAQKGTNEKYKLSDFFLETTAGRLVFSSNFNQILKTD